MGLVLRNAPRYLLAFTLGFVVAFLSDMDVTALTIVGVLLGILIAPLWGVVVFLSAWILLRALVRATR